MYLNKRSIYLQYFLQAGNKKVRGLYSQHMPIYQLSTLIWKFEESLFDIFTSSVYMDESFKICEITEK